MSARPSIRAALDTAARVLRDAGLEEARREAQVLLGHALGVGREAMIGDPERPLGGGEAAVFETLVARRAAREPCGGVRARPALPEGFTARPRRRVYTVRAEARIRPSPPSWNS